MTTFCRDVVTTSGMDEFGSGTRTRGFAPVGLSTAAIGLSLFAGVFAAVMIYLAIKGRFASRDGDSKGEFKAVATIEFV